MKQFLQGFKALSILTLLFIFSYLLAGTGKGKYFSYIINKKENLDGILQNFSFTTRFTAAEIKELKLDTTKIQREEYYKLANQPFLTKEIPGLKFTLYYKAYTFGQLEKVLRVTNGNSTHDIVLAGEYGDADYGRLSSEFINDSVLIQTVINKETVKDGNHSMVYSVDSIITKYKYNDKFEFIKSKRDSFHYSVETAQYHKELKDSVFKVRGASFTINKIICNWEYDVKYTDETNEKSKEVYVNITGWRLMKLNTKQVLLECDMERFIDLLKTNIADLDFTAPQNNQTYLNYDRYAIADINFDGYNDIYFRTEKAPTGNSMYVVHLFVPGESRFEYSAKLSDGSLADKGILLDEKTRTAIYSGRGGGGLYSIRKVHFDERGNIAGEEQYHNDFVNNKQVYFYKKISGDKVIEEMKKEADGDDWDNSGDKFFEWAGFDVNRFYE